MVQLRDGTRAADPRLDRLVQFDERSREFPVRRLLATATPPRRDKTWRLDRWRQGNQGQEGACVEYGIMHSVLGQPKAASIHTARAVWKDHLVYWEAQRNDPWQGGSYPGASPFYEGTSVLAGLKAAQALGFFGSYYWSFSPDEFLNGVHYVGPAVIGINWHEGMMNPKSDGLIQATGQVIGGHCVDVIGIDYGRLFLAGRKDVAVIAQSWGPGHGHKGRVYLPLDQLWELLAANGEAAFITDRNRLKRLPS